jgi:hypothetical protein
MHQVITDYSSFDFSNAPVKAFVRLRPPYKEPHRISWFLNSTGPTILEIRDPNPARQNQVRFSFNRVFGPETKQSIVSDAMMKPQIDHVLGGLNACCFAYGQVINCFCLSPVDSA